MLLLYAGGIAALSAGNYAMLLTLFATRLRGSSTGKQSQAAVVATVDSILEVDRLGLFKSLPGFEKLYVPRSEYLFKTLQPDLEDLLFLGNGYEGLFDRFEIFYALSYLDLQDEKSYVWAPPGRFGWKHHLHDHNSPYNEVIKEANQQQSAWGPTSSGMFSGSLDRFNNRATAFAENILNKLQWW